jgi:hypothetical protein
VSLPVACAPVAVAVAVAVVVSEHTTCGLRWWGDGDACAAGVYDKGTA